MMLQQAENFFRRAPGQQIVVCDDFLTELQQLPRESTVVFSGRSCAAALRDAGFDVWCGVEPEPCMETVEKMITFLRSKKSVSAVVAAGGGSVLDAAKAAYLCYQSNWQLAEHFGMHRWSSVNGSRQLRRIIAIPTTSGTGSEATVYSNIVDRKNQVKKLIVEREILPEKAVLVPELTFSMPADLTRATGCDALAHLLEGFLNTGADRRLADGSDPNEWALLGIKLVKKYLLTAIKKPQDSEARRGMMYASALGGMTIAHKSTGLPHLCSFSWFGRIAHGDAVAMLLPECWRYYLGNPVVEKRTLALHEVFPGSDAAGVIAAYREFITAAGLPEKLSAWEGIDELLLDNTARNGAQNRMKLELAPRPVPLEQSYAILKEILMKSF